MKEWISATGNIGHWLEKWDLKPGKVRILIQFPDRTTCEAAKAALKQEMLPQLAYVNTDPFRPTTINGLNITFTYQGEP